MKLQSICLIVILLIFTMSYTSCDKDDPSPNIFSIQDDIDLGKQTMVQIESDPEYPILDRNQYPLAYAHLERIRDNVLNSGKLKYEEEFEWTVKIIDKDVLNAFCLPGGYMYYYTGLIKFLDNEAQFAGVMAHEMAHADRRHSTDNITKEYGISFVLEAILGEDPGLMAQIGASLLTLQFSRSNENEADEYSVIYLYETGYDARGAAGFFQKLLDEENKGINIPLFSTHPTDVKRIENINAKWVELGSKTGELFDSTYQEFKESLPK